MGLFSIFSTARTGLFAGSDTSALAVAADRRTIRTLSAVNRFIALTAADVQRFEQEFSKRQEQSRNYQRYLEICAQWECVDVNDTEALANYKSALAGNIVQKMEAIAKSVAKSEQARYQLARIDHSLQKEVKSTDEKIKELQAKRAAISKFFANKPMEAA